MHATNVPGDNGEKISLADMHEHSVMYYMYLLFVKK